MSLQSLFYTKFRRTLMKKIVLSTMLLMLVLVLSVCFVACNGETNTSDTGTSGTSGSSDTSNTTENNNPPAVDIGKEVEIDGITYVLKSAGSYWLKDAKEYAKPELVIPNDIEGIPVTSIYDSAFEGNTNLISVTIADNVHYISNLAFKGCTALREVKFSENSQLTAIYPEAFMGCSSLVSFTVPKNVTSIDLAAFLDCNKLVEVINRSKLFLEKGATNHGHLANYAITVTRSASATSEIITQGDFLFYVYDRMEYIDIEDENGNVIERKKVRLIDRYLLSYTGTATEVTLPASFTDPADDKEYDYTVYPYAFAYNTSLKKVTIPDSVLTIGKFAFIGCTAVEEMTVPYVGDNNGNFHFGYLFGALASNQNGEYVPETLKTITVTSAARIGYRGFYDLKHVTKINLPNTLTSIGTDVFRGCIGLTELTLPESLESIESMALRDCTGLISITIPSKITLISTRLFDGCTALKTVSLPAGILEVEAEAFRGCTAIEEVTLPAGVTVLNDRLFSGCTELKTIIALGAITAIGNEVFSNCAKLATFAVPENLLSVGSNAFQNCTAIVTVENGVTYFGKWAVACDPAAEAPALRADTVGIAASTFKGCTLIKTIELPATIAFIGAEAFSGCSNLKSIALPNSLTAIADNTFMDCVKLESVSIPATIQYIGTAAFQNCKALKAVSLPAGIEIIKSNTFYGCVALTEFTVPESVTVIEPYAFEGCKKLANVTFENVENWVCVAKENLVAGTAMDVSDAAANAKSLVNTKNNPVYKHFWKVIVPEEAPEKNPEETPEVTPEG